MCMNNVIYEGFFIDGNLNSKLAKNIDNKHVTTEFRPSVTHEYLYGEKVKLRIDAYGNDGENEGLFVNGITTDNLDVLLLFMNVETPHITLSVSENGKPVNTSKIKFSETWNGDEYIDATFGAFTGKEVITCCPMN